MKGKVVAIDGFSFCIGEEYPGQEQERAAPRAVAEPWGMPWGRGRRSERGLWPGH